MRVLFFIENYLPDIVAGGQLCVYQATKRLARNSCNEVMIVTTTSNRACKRHEVTQENVTIERIYIPPFPKIPLLNQTMLIILRETMIATLSILPLARIIRRFRPDVINVNVNIFAAIPAFLASKLNRTKVVVWAHGILKRNYLVSSYGRFAGYLFYYAQKLLMLLPYNKIVALSKDTKDIFLRMGVKEHRVAVIPNGVDIEKFVIRSLPKRSNEFIVGYIGRLTPGKGVNHLIRGMQQVIQQFPRTKLLIVGEGEYRSQLELLSRELGISDKVTFSPPVDPEDMPEVIHNLDIIVLPSLTEVMPLIMIEAMACGKVFIGTRVGGIPEVVENYVDGIVLESNDADALSKAITKVLSDDMLRESMGIKARKKAENYSWDTIVSKLEGLYLQVSDIGLPAHEF